MEYGEHRLWNDRRRWWSRTCGSSFIEETPDGGWLDDKRRPYATPTRRFSSRHNRKHVLRSFQDWNGIGTSAVPRPVMPGAGRATAAPNRAAEWHVIGQPLPAWMSYSPNQMRSV